MAVTVKSSKKKNTTSLLVGAIIFGIIAALGSILYLKIKEKAIRDALLAKEEQMIQVVVARGDLPKGTQIGNNNMATRSLPKQYVYKASVRPAEFGLYKGRYLTESLGKGTPLLSTMVKAEFSKDFSDTIGDGRRAMTIQVDEINTISGFIRPGNFVDLFVKLNTDIGVDAKQALAARAASLKTLSSESLAKEAQTLLASLSQNSLPAKSIIPVLQRVRVLATGQTATGDFQEKYRYAKQQNPFSYNNLTLDVSPRQAALLATARDSGDLLALLRNRKDNSGATFTKVTPGDLLSNATSIASKNLLRAKANSADDYCEIKKGDINIKDGTVYNKRGKVVDYLVARPDGSVVARDGREVMNTAGAITPGFGMNSHGKMITDPNVVVKNCIMMTKDGQILSGRGLTVDKNGRLITKDGKVIDAGNIRVTKDGKLITADGTILDDTNIMVGKDGKVMTANDMRVTKDGFIVDKDGNVYTKDGKLLKGVTLGADGKVRSADGTVLKADDIVVNADGSVTTKDGKPIAGVTGVDSPAAAALIKQMLAKGMRKTKDGFIVDADGNVYLPDGTLVKGAKLDANGNVIAPDGTVLKAHELVVNADGTISNANGEVIAGLTADTTSAKAKAMRALLKSQGADEFPAATYEFITGGSSDGVSKVTEVPIRE